MDTAAGPDKGLMSLKEVVERTGIPAATIRYYDQQFEEYLGITRGRAAAGCSAKAPWIGWARYAACSRTRA